MTARMAIEST